MQAGDESAARSFCKEYMLDGKLGEKKGEGMRCVIERERTALHKHVERGGRGGGRERWRERKRGKREKEKETGSGVTENSRKSRKDNPEMSSVIFYMNYH